MKKRILSAVLSLALLLSLLPAGALAAEPEGELIIGVGDLGTTELFADGAVAPLSLTDGAVDMASGNHEAWIDRVDLPTEVDTFYAALVEASDNDGIADWLIDPTVATKTVKDNNNNTYTVIEVITVNGNHTADNDTTRQYHSACIQAASNAFDRDHPEVFWLSGQSQYLYSSDGSTTTYSYVLQKKSSDGTVTFDVRDTASYANAAAIQVAITQRDSYINAIKAATVNWGNETLTYSGAETDYEKVRFFNAWLTTNNQYNTSVSGGNSSAADKAAWECVSALDGRTGSQGPVCEGYARAFKVLCDLEKIPCVLVDGTAKSSPDATTSGAHMWNYTQVEGKWYAVDVTWNDPTGSGDNGAVSNHESENYLLVGSSTQNNNITFIDSHPVSNTVSDGGVAFTNGPTLEAEKYVVKEKLTGSVTIAGTPKFGEELTAEVSGSNASSFTYQWYRGDEAIPGANSDTYTPTSAEDVGKTIKVEVTAENYSGKLTASVNGVVAKGDGPAAPTDLTATSITSDSITVTANDTWEYSKDNGSSWQASNVFTGLAPSTGYSIVARVKETATHNASAASAALSVTTNAGPISAVTVSDLDAPATGAAPDTSVTVTPEGLTATVAWYVGSSPFSGSSFAASTAYTVRITLETSGTDTFANTVTAQGYTVQRTNNTQITLTKTFPATADKTVTGISITSQPTNLKYTEGDSFDTTGMVVTATYNDGSSAAVTGYTVTPDPLTADTTSVTITYMGKEATVSGLTVLKVPTLDQFDITLPANPVYDGNAKAAAVTAKNGVTDMGAVTVKYNGKTTAPTDAGTYTVTFDVAESGSYAAVTDLSAGEFTIAKATPKITVTNTITVVKNTSQTLTATIDPDTLTLGFTSADPGIAQVDNTGNVTGVAEGNTTITVAFAGNENYEAVSADVAVTVTGKTPVTVTFADAPSQTYKPEGYNLGAQFTAATVEGDGKTITSYKYDGKTYDTLSELPTVTDAGTYQVTAVYETDTEYGEATASFTITKAEQDALTVTSTGPAIYGQNYGLTTEGGSGTGEVTFAVTNGTGTADINGSNLVPTQAGDVTVTATKAGDNNYNPVTSDPVTITIDKAAYPNATTASGYVKAGTAGYVILPALPGGASYGAVIYGDAATSPEQVADPTVDGVRLSYTGGPNVAVGSTYTLTVAIDGGVNYEDATLTVKLTGTDLITPTLTVEPISITYTGSPIPASAINGTATVDGAAVDGSWSWSAANSKTPTDVADSGKEFYVTFTPADGALYAPTDIKIEVTIAKATPTGAPKYTAITSAGKTLADAGLTAEGGTFSVPGTVAWELADTTTVQANASYKWIFTPTDGANYNTLSSTVVLYRVGGTGGGGGGGSSSSDDDDDYTPPSNTDKNPDGSTTTTTTKADGTTVETTKYTDGSKEVVETAKDGTVTTTTTDRSGNETKVVEATDGTTTTTLEKTDGSSSTTTVSRDGRVTAQVSLPQSVLTDAAGEAVALPMPSVSASSDRSSAPTVTVDLPADSAAKVEIPVKNPTAGTVAVLVKADGTEEVIKTSLTTQNGVAVTLSGGDTVKIVDNTKTFGDVPATYWGSSAVAFAASRELFTGTGENTFTPDGNMTRGMIVTVLARFDGVDTSTGATWYQAGQQWAMANGISDGTNLDGSVSREQLATMLYRYAGSPVVSGSLTGYPDGTSVSSYASDAMIWAVETGLISGTDMGTLDPQGQATRAQVATILMRFVASVA